MASSSNKLDVQLSKTLSYLLRHGAIERDLAMDSNGFCKLNDVIKELNKMLPRQNVTLDRINKIVKDCSKQRFKLETFNGALMIRANQGHSMQEVEDIKLKEITIFDTSSSGKIIHGTTLKAWESIMKTGLNKMKRNHIHMAKGEFGKAKSGARFSSEVIITIDGNGAIQDGIKFFESDNGVILSSGNYKGIIEPKYFLNVYDRKLKKQIFP